MITIRKSTDRGHANHGWLDSFHTFSFADYHDPAHMGFGPLRVINEDRVQGGAGFPTHGHRDMEIISYVISGALEHKDNLGTGSVIVPGDVQRMTAGRGVMHSEYNASKTEKVHFLQIWVLPRERGLPPAYEQKTFADERRGKLRIVASPDGRQGSLSIHQDVEIYAALLSAGQAVAHSLAPGRSAWVQVARGSVTLDGVPLVAGDGASVRNQESLNIAADADSEILLFDLAAF